MKCEIIRDLLPLYIEGLCSEESRSEIEAHLEGCEECRQEYLQLRQDYVLHSAGREAEDFAEEKKVLEKNKKAVMESLADRIIDKIFTFVFASALILNIAMVVITFLLYRYQYPKLYLKELGSAQVLILLLPFLPTLLAAAGKAAVRKGRKYKLLSRILAFGLIPSVLFGAFCTLAFMVIPPISSTTHSLADYRKLDGETERFEKNISHYFPTQIPDSAEQASYFYQRYPTFFSENIYMEASWILPPSEYQAVRQYTLELNQFKNSSLSESGGNGAVLSTISADNLTIIFEYNDTLSQVTYRAYTNRRY